MSASKSVRLGMEPRSAAAATQSLFDWSKESAEVMPAFLRLLGLQDLGVTGGEASIVLVIDPLRHVNGLGVAHGGVLCTLLDVVMGYSAASHRDQWQPILTLSQTVQFVATAAGRIRAQGRVTGGGRAIVHCTGEVRDERGELLASGVATFKRFKKMLPAADGTAAKMVPNV